MTRTVLITGCSKGGIGSALGLALADRKYHIFATLRDPSKIAPELKSHRNVTVLCLDVTNQESIASAVTTVSQDAKGAGLDILINNAGSGYTMPLLDAGMDVGRKLFETNVWGLLATTRCFVDLLEKTKGMVVNISSVGAIVNTPWIGMYSASKAAVTSLSETIRLELQPFGIDVMTVMAGSVSTSFFVNTPTFTLPESSKYTAIHGTIEKWAKDDGVRPKVEDITKFTENVVSDIEARRTGKIWRGGNAQTMKFMSNYVPDFFIDYIMRKIQGLNDLVRSIKEQKDKAA